MQKTNTNTFKVKQFKLNSLTIKQKHVAQNSTKGELYTIILDELASIHIVNNAWKLHNTSGSFLSFVIHLKKCLHNEGL